MPWSDTLQWLFTGIKGVALVAAPFLLKALLDRTPDPQVEEGRIISQRLDNMKKSLALVEAMRGMPEVGAEKARLWVEFSRIVDEQADQEGESLKRLEAYFSKRNWTGLGSVWFTRPRREALIARRFRVWGLLLGMVGLIVPNLPAVVLWTATPPRSFAIGAVVVGLFLFVSGAFYLQIYMSTAMGAMLKLRLDASLKRSFTQAKTDAPTPVAKAAKTPGVPPDES